MDLFSLEYLRLEVLFLIVHLISKTEELSVHDLDKLVRMLTESVDERVCRVLKIFELHTPVSCKSVVPLFALS